MQYKVVPFKANIDKTGSAKTASDQFDKVIAAAANEGWEYYSLEDLTTGVAPDNGCFGLGAKPGYNISVQCIVFRKP